MTLFDLELQKKLEYFNKKEAKLFKCFINQEVTMDCNDGVVFVADVNDRTIIGELFDLTLAPIFASVTIIDWKKLSAYEIAREYCTNEYTDKTVIHRRSFDKYARNEDEIGKDKVSLIINTFNISTSNIYKIMELKSVGALLTFLSTVPTGQATVELNSFTLRAYENDEGFYDGYAIEVTLDNTFDLYSKVESLIENNHKVNAVVITDGYLGLQTMYVPYGDKKVVKQETNGVINLFIHVDLTSEELLEIGLSQYSINQLLDFLIEQPLQYLEVEDDEVLPY